MWCALQSWLSVMRFPLCAREHRSLRDIHKCETVWRPDCPHLRIIPAEPASCQKMNSSRQTQGVCKIKVTTMTLQRNMHVHITGNPEGGRWAAKLLNDTSHFFDSRLLPKILWSCSAFVKNRYIASSYQKERAKEKKGNNKFHGASFFFQITS